MKVVIKRSQEWTIAQRIARAENVPAEITVDVSPQSLSEENRRNIITYEQSAHAYPVTLDRISYGQNYTPSTWSTYGNEPFLCDADTPTAEQIDNAIRDAFARVAAKKAKHEAERAERERVAAEEERAKEAARKARADAREILKDDIARIETAAADYKKDRETLADFLASFPNDALRGALKNYAAQSTSIDAVKKKIEDASPVVIFEDEEIDC